MNIPTWNKRYGDEVVCLSELKLGLMAQSCLAPGFATLMANTFVMRALPQVGIDFGMKMIKRSQYTLNI